MKLTNWIEKNVWAEKILNPGVISGGSSSSRTGSILLTIVEGGSSSSRLGSVLLTLRIVGGGASSIRESV